MKLFFKNHYLAVIFALLVGAICIAPHIIFKISLGNEYKGIYLAQTNNELDYLGRIEEIKDGHWTLGSVPFFEYKDKPPLAPPSILEILIAVISRIFKISIANIVILTKFFLPAFLFLLIYFLILKLTESDRLAAKINAVAGGLFIVLGYDLVDYSSIFKYLAGANVPDTFLLWTRPVNPILGGILVFSFLLIVLSLYRNEDRTRGRVFLGGLIFALAIMSYFFSWGMILPLIAVLALVALLKFRYDFIKKLFLICLVGFILAAPYFYNVFTAMKDPSYQRSALNIGLLLNHRPILNKFLIFSLFIFLIISFYKRKQIFRIPDWWLFSLAMIFAGFIAFNQQIITGRTIWPFHFVQYTIPLGIAALFTAFYNIFSASGKKNFNIWMTTAVFLMAVSIFFGIYTQVSAYKQNYIAYKGLQKYSDIFNWINGNFKKDCVILAEADDFLNSAIPAFTRCNVYSFSTNGFLTPFKRLYHNYLTHLRLKGVKPDEIADFLDKNGKEAVVYLYGVESFLYGASSPSFVAAKDKIAADYRDFSKKDLKSELRRYKLDYIAVAAGNLSGEMKNLIGGLNPIYSFDNMLIYQFK